MIEDQNQGQEQEQGQNQNSENEALKAEIEALKAKMAHVEMSVGASSFPATVAIEKIPLDSSEFEVFARQHLDAHLPASDRSRMINFEAFKQSYVRAVANIRKNWDDYKRIIASGNESGRDMAIVNEVRQNVALIQSFKLRVPRDSSFKPLIDPNNEVFKFRSKREIFAGGGY